MKGKKIKVTTPTNINAILEFAGGAQITLGASWDVWKHGHAEPDRTLRQRGLDAGARSELLRGRDLLLRERGGDYVDVDTVEWAVRQIQLAVDRCR